MVIKLFVGIGNIGSKYNNTRHNFGHKYIQLLAKNYQVHLKKNDMLCGYIGNLQLHNTTTRLFIPIGYMNHVGSLIYKCINYYQLSVQEILIAHDELDLSPGTIRIKLGRKINESHRGIRDIIAKLNNNFSFYRLRIGIGRPHNKNEVANFVLSQPSVCENNKIDFIIHKSFFYTSDIMFGNFTKVMNQLHSRK